MTQTQRNNISRGLKEARRRRRLSVALKAHWARKAQQSAPEVRNNNPMNIHQLIADICREYELEFTLGQFDDLLVLCQEFHKRHNEIH